jgi:uncharacterized integral membrane protein
MIPALLVIAGFALMGAVLMGMATARDDTALPSHARR